MRLLRHWLRFNINQGAFSSARVRHIAFVPDHAFELGGVRAKEPRNSIEIDTYPPTAKPRPRPAGQLPPGNAIASFSVADLDAIKAKYISPPAKLYGNTRAASFIGPAGELMELIEETRA